MSSYLKDVPMIRINGENGETFKSALSGKINIVIFVCFFEVTDSPFSFRSGFAIVMHCGLLYGVSMRACIGLPYGASAIETKCMIFQ